MRVYFKKNPVNHAILYPFSIISYINWVDTELKVQKCKRNEL